MTSQNSNDTVVPLFKNRTDANVVLEDGTLVPFANKMFYTHDKQLIERLEKAAARNEFGIYIDPVDKDIDLEAATPMERLRKQIRQELEAELKTGKTVIAGSSSSVQVPVAAGLATTVNSQPEQQSQLPQDVPIATEVASTAAKPEDKTPELSTLEKLKASSTSTKQP